MKYFAYGSNMSSEELRGWCPGAEFAVVAMLPNYRLDFTRYSAKRQGGVADVVRARGETVWGVLYNVPSGEMAALDRKEGVAAMAYERKRVTVAPAVGPRVRAVTYTVIDKEPGQTPGEHYLGLILTGAREWALPEAYVRMLEKFGQQQSCCG